MRPAQEYPGVGGAGVWKISIQIEYESPTTIAIANSIAPEPAPGGAFARDRATAVTTAIIQIVDTALLNWFHGDDAGLTAVRAEIEALLRQNFTTSTTDP